ncbi:adhesion G protein-coupled receptor B3-like [Haliotis rufescens]|uniref:adhesion G protein-coupled receptor B3-like n=1 Tax=Haliotis rufescens TaxID=6454 RepID=UPI00201F2247|nr:adhesion G protein-coupled receptor B3-like [Haliotis rufescens]
MQSRDRTCTNSTCCPANLELSQTQNNTCEICQCPTISLWSEWTDEGSCSTTCGQGTQMQSRDRTCTDSTCCPANFESSQTRNNTCEICPCPVIGPWCPWGNTCPCSVTCGRGTQRQARNRACVNTCTPPDCIKREERTVTCTQAPCHTAWTTWNRWSGASTWNRWSGASTWNRWSGASTWNRWSGASTWNRWSGGSTWNRWSGSTRNRRRGSTRNRRRGSTTNRRRGSWRRRFYWG